MNAIKNIHAFSLLATIIIFGFTSCERLAIAPDPTDGPERNFEIFWSDLYNTYPYFQKDNVDWKQTYESYRSQITKSTTDFQLFGIFTQMMNPLSDGHMSVVSADNKYQWQHNDRYKSYAYNYYSYNVFRTYLNQHPFFSTSRNPQNNTNIDTVVDYGIISNDIIYYHIQTFNTKFKFEDQLDSLSNANPNAKGIILDLRFNGGGYLLTAWNFLGLFFDKEFTYARNKEKVGPLDNEYGPVEDLHTTLGTHPIITKKVIVLTCRYTASAAEHTVLALRKRPNTTIIGDNTAGAQSFIVERTLPNGMKFTAVNSQTFDTDGTIYEEIGIPPNEKLDISIESYLEGRDDILDRAIQNLQTP